MHAFFPLAENKRYTNIHNLLYICNKYPSQKHEAIKLALHAFNRSPLGTCACVWLKSNHRAKCSPVQTAHSGVYTFIKVLWEGREHNFTSPTYSVGFYIATFGSWCELFCEKKWKVNVNNITQASCPRTHKLLWKAALYGHSFGLYKTAPIHPHTGLFLSRSPSKCYVTGIIITYLWSKAREGAELL